MPTPLKDAVNYIRRSKRKGLKNAEIRQILKDHHYNQKTIDTIFRKYYQSKIIQYSSPLVILLFLFSVAALIKPEIVGYVVASTGSEFGVFSILLLFFILGFAFHFAYLRKS
jgi:hypothetical protein